MALPAENPTSTPPNYTSRDDDTTLHTQTLESTGVADTIPRSLDDRGEPTETDLRGPAGQWIGWNGY